MSKACHSPILVCAAGLFLIGTVTVLGADDLARSFRDPPPSARPGVYWYFMDGNLSREGMTRDLESMKAAGIGHLVFLEVNVGVPRGPVGFLSEEWQDLFAHAVRESERLGIEITLGSGPGWTGSGGPWVKPEQSMQHLVSSKVEVQGPGPFKGTLPVPPPRRPFFGDVPAQLRGAWEEFFKDVAVLAFPTPATQDMVSDLDEKALVYRAPFSSQPNVKPRLEAPADFPPGPEGSGIPCDRILDLTTRLKPEGTLDWQVPAGKWTVLRFVSRNNGASTRPAPDPGIGFECDKFDSAALDAHFEQYVGKLLKKVGPRQRDRGWTMLHMDSWEMGAQNWTPRFREEFRERRGYDPQPFYPAYAGFVVGSREQTERFLWDLRMTGQELVIENHAEHLKRLGRKHGFTLSIEPYDMNPVNDFDLGAVADVPMCEFWSLGFDTAFSCHTASSIAHVLGRPVVAAEAFTAGAEEAWRFYPGSLKNQGDWAFATGINRLTYHTFAHKPDETRPGMVMGPYGVHWDRGQTWWSMAGAYHRYIARCQFLLRQGRTVADVLYLMPEGAPNVFQPPASAFVGSSRLPDRRGYNFDGCSADTFIKLARVREGCIEFVGGAAYRVLVLPDVETMTPGLLRKIESLVKAGATVVGSPPRKSPSLMNYPESDQEVARLAEKIWDLPGPPLARSVGQSGVNGHAAKTIRRYGKGQVVWGKALSESQAAGPSSILKAQWIWDAEDNAAESAAVGSVSFRREFSVPGSNRLLSARLEMTADNGFKAALNGKTVLQGDNFHQVFAVLVTDSVMQGTNLLTVVAENSGASRNPAGLIGALRLHFADNSEHLIVTDETWRSELAVSTEGGEVGNHPVKVLGAATMSPWRLKPATITRSLYPRYELTSAILRDLGLVEDFVSSGPIRYTHRRTANREIYFLANRSDEVVNSVGTFRVTVGTPEIWDPIGGGIRRLPEFEGGSDRTIVPLKFEPLESYFVVFPTGRDRPGSRDIGRGLNFPVLSEIQTITEPWHVSFEPGMGAPESVVFEKLEDWTKRPEPGVKHFSGVATYRTKFELAPSEIKSGHGSIHLDLGAVQMMARVRLNGTGCGVVWTAPWRVDISHLAKSGLNHLEIEVANLWPNRMIGDAAGDQKFTATTYRPYKADDPLLTSGLLGPVRLLKATPEVTAPGAR